MDDEMEDIKKKLAELDELKKRIEGKANKPVERNKQIKVSRVTTEKRDYYEDPKEEVDPVSKYLGGDSVPSDGPPGRTSGMEQIKKQDKDFIHKRIAAQEVSKYLRQGVFFLVMNIIGFFAFYMMIVLRSGLLIDIVMFAMIMANAIFLFKFRRQELYLIRKYNIQVQGNLFSGMNIPKVRRYNPRGPRFMQNPQQEYYDEQGDPKEHQDQEQGDGLW